jgi:hypothetical protein
MTRYKGKLIFTLDGKEMTFNEALQMEGFDANLLTISYKVMGSEDKNTRIGDLLDEIDKERQEAARPGVSNAFNMDPLTQGTVFDSRLWTIHMSAQAGLFGAILETSMNNKILQLAQLRNYFWE